MARMILGFVILWACVVVGITAFRSLTGKEKWELVKLLTFTGACAIIAFVLLMALVILF